MFQLCFPRVVSRVRRPLTTTNFRMIPTVATIFQALGGPFYYEARSYYDNHYIFPTTDFVVNS